MVAIEEYQRVCVVDIAGSAIPTVFLLGFSRLSCLLSRILQIICLTCIWSKCVDTSFHGHSSQNPQQNPSGISHFSKKIVALR